MDAAVSIKTKWEAEEGRCLALPQSLASISFQATEERVEVVEPLLPHKKVMDRALQQEPLSLTWTRR